VIIETAFFKPKAFKTKKGTKNLIAQAATVLGNFLDKHPKIT
jgi:hypothetical protein